MKKLINAATALLGFATAAIITSLIQGQPLTGLIRLEGLYQTLIQGSVRVPAWAFVLALLLTMFGTYYAITHLPVRRPKGKVHFVPDAHNCGWSKRSDKETDVRIGGTFTYEGQGQLVILKAYLKGTQPTTDLAAQVEKTDGSRGTTSEHELWLRPNNGLRAFVFLILTPALGTPGQSLRKKLILLDQRNREFFIGPIELPYIGQT